MTQEDKELLLKDLCARLPYGVKIHIDFEEIGHIVGDATLDSIKTVTGQVFDFVDFEQDFKNGGSGLCGNKLLCIDEFKPYLRPMSTMTEEEKEELKQEHVKDEKLYAECLTKAANGDSSMRGKVVPHFAADWCNKNYFDYRGLIEKGLALEAPEGMYKIK